MSYKSKYRGQEVEDLLDKIDGFGESSEYLSKREAVQMYQPKGDYLTERQDISGKVDKVEGKGLSTEDFTTALKDKLESLSNFDSSEIEKSISDIQSEIDTLVSGDASKAIESFNEIIAFLEGIEDSEDLSSIIASIEQSIAKKADASSLSKVAKSGDYNDLKNKPTIPSLDGYATENYVQEQIGDINDVLVSIING
jgi:hypothetical protein